jgi:hypothetical protein
MIIETVKIKGGSKGSRIINKCDFDPAFHELYDGASPPAAQPLEETNAEIALHFLIEKPKPARKAK